MDHSVDVAASTKKNILQGASKKSNPLPFFVNISVMNWNFYKKIYADILVHICAYVPNYVTFPQHLTKLC